MFFTITVQLIHIYKPPTIMMMTVLPWPYARCVLTCGISLYNTSCYVEHGNVTSNIWMRRSRLGQELKVTQINGRTKIQTQLSLCSLVIWIAQNFQRRWTSSLLNYVYVLMCRGQGASHESRCSPSSVEVRGMEFRSSGWLASANAWSILPPPSLLAS